MATGLSRILRGPLLVLGLSESVSGVGSWITMMAVFALVVFRGRGGVLESGGIMLAGLVPVLLGSPLAGWLCDRVDRRRLMVASELASGLLVSVLIFVSDLVLVYPVLALAALAGSIMTPARRAVVPVLVGREELPRANAFLQQLNGSIKIGAPLLAGALLAVLDPHTAIALDVLSFFASALLLTRLPRLRPPAPEATSGVPAVGEKPDAFGAVAQIGSGDGGCGADRACGSDAQRPAEQPPRRARVRKLRHGVFELLRSSPALKLLFATAFFAIFVIIGFDILVSVFVRDVLRSSESVFGLLVSLVGLGTVGVSLALMLGKARREPWGDVLLGLLLLSAIPFSFALTAFVAEGPLRTAMAAAGCLIGGVGNGLLNVQTGTLLQVLTPASRLGRTAGAFQSVAVAGQLVGGVLTPLLVPAIVSMTGYFFAAFAGLALVVAWIYRSTKSARVDPALSAGE